MEISHRANKPLIISASRRTDIPAFHSDWFRKQLEQNYCVYKNPFSGKDILIDLSPENVLGFVFWSRFPQPLFKHLEYIDNKYGNRHYINFTINNFPRELETSAPDLNNVLKSVDYLAARYGKGYIQWRYDPIIISNITSIEFIIKNFEFLCSQLQDKTENCIISFVDIYAKTKRNLQKQNIKLYDISNEKKTELIIELCKIASKKNINISLCCEKELYESSKFLIETKINHASFLLKQSSCVSNKILSKISNLNSEREYATKPSRKGCLCIESKDIGTYDTCSFGCVYCYANKNFG